MPEFDLCLFVVVTLSSNLVSAASPSGYVTRRRGSRSLEGCRASLQGIGETWEPRGERAPEGRPNMMGRPSGMCAQGGEKVLCKSNAKQSEQNEAKQPKLYVYASLYEHRSTLMVVIDTVLIHEPIRMRIKKHNDRR